jgi:AbiV family abortive infection protein
MSDFEEEWWNSVEEALAVGQRIAVTSEEFNEALDHIVRLLIDASLLLESGSHATSCFLAITALEETAKIHIGMYRRSAEPVPRKKDALFRHDRKHHIAAAPTVVMGSRLQEAIGENRLHELLELARSGGLVNLREASLYIGKPKTRFNCLPFPLPRPLPASHYFSRSNHLTMRLWGTQTIRLISAN